MGAVTLAVSSYDRGEYSLLQQHQSDSEGEETTRRIPLRRVRARADKMNLSVFNRPLFQTASLTVSLIGLTLVITTLAWVGQFKGGVSFTTTEKGIDFNWHPILMTISLIFLYGNGALIYRVIPARNESHKLKLKLGHAGAMLLAFILMVIGLKAFEDLDMAIQKLEQEKTNRDHSIRTLNDEIANQDEVINKLNKEKKHMSENSSKAQEDLQAAEDKVDHLAKIKAKLESTLDELQGSLNGEKRARADIEKTRRRVEGDLKVTQETVSELERQKKEAEGAIQRKEKDLTGLSSKLDDEQQLVGKVQKAIKEVQSRVEELEEELEAERQARAKAERQRSDLARELESLGERLNEAGGATSAQVELNKKRDCEINKLRKDLEEAKIQQEATLMG